MSLITEFRSLNHLTILYHLILVEHYFFTIQGKISFINIIFIATMSLMIKHEVFWARVMLTKNTVTVHKNKTLEVNKK